MRPPVVIGTDLSSGIEFLRLHQKLKMGNVVQMPMPFDKAEALAVARYCREHKVFLCFSEFMDRDSFELSRRYRAEAEKRPFMSKADVAEVIDAAGEYYIGRFCVGEVGGSVYWPQKYKAEAGQWQRPQRSRTMKEACDAYVALVKRFFDYERETLGKGPLLDIDASMLFKYHAMSGADALCLEAMPGDPQIMHAALRGAAKAFEKPWGTHIAMQCYGGVRLEERWQRRLKSSFCWAYIAGAQWIWTENSQFRYDQRNRQRFGFHSKEMARARRTVREMHQFASIHRRPESGPLVRLGVVHGHLDGAPGLWNPAAWGQDHDPKWLEGPAERSWRFVDRFHRSEDWPNESVQGELDFSGNPPYGQYDAVPIEAPLEKLKKYGGLLFLGWNTMTGEIYEKLKQYVKAGGHLVMYLPHLSVETDRARPARLYRNGDFADLFGCKVLGRAETKIQGINCVTDSSLKAYRFPRWRISTDPRFLGHFTPARVKVTTGKVISSYCDHYVTDLKELLAQPFVIENRLGKGAAFLAAAWQYPADDGVARFTRDLLRTVIQGEQGHIRLVGSDRIRYAVYQGAAPGSLTRYSVVYLMNSNADTSATTSVWVRGKLSGTLTVPANELRPAYLFGDLLLVPQSKLVDLAAWDRRKTRDAFTFFSAGAQEVEIFNLGRSARTVSVNGRRHGCRPGERVKAKLARKVDPERKAFFAPGFLDEPKVAAPAHP